MADLTPELAEKITAAITANAEEAAGAIGRAFEGEYVLKAGEASPRGDTSPDGAGLVFAFKFGDEAMLALLPASGGLVPDWVREPDVTGASKLSTLSQELSMLIVPDTLIADSFEVAWIEDLTAGVQQSQPAEDATRMPVEIAQGEALGELVLVWPVAAPDGALGRSASRAAGAHAAADAAPDAAPKDTSDKPSQSKVLRQGQRPPGDFRDLPPNTRSALQVNVALSVNLAGKKMKLQEVVELGPGAIITFDKSCDSALEVTVGGQPIASGEAVKVGDRFGVRVQEMILPEEHFRPMLPSRPRAS